MVKIKEDINFYSNFCNASTPCPMRNNDHSLTVFSQYSSLFPTASSPASAASSAAPSATDSSSASASARPTAAAASPLRKSSKKSLIRKPLEEFGVEHWVAVFALLASR